ncbi:MAG TPA: hypothetical protein VGD26_09710 [Chitinophagaceae bacterium]
MTKEYEDEFFDRLYAAIDRAADMYFKDYLDKWNRRAFIELYRTVVNIHEIHGRDWHPSEIVLRAKELYDNHKTKVFCKICRYEHYLDASIIAERAHFPQVFNKKGDEIDG